MKLYIYPNNNNNINENRWYHSHPNYGCWLSGTDVKT